MEMDRFFATEYFGGERTVELNVIGDQRAYRSMGSTVPSSSASIQRPLKAKPSD